MAAKLKKGDKVVVIAGRDKGKRGEILQVFPEKGRAIVSGVNLVKKHQKPTPQQQGGIIQKEAPIHLSNLMLEDPKDGSPTRVGFTVNKEGRKVRVARKSGEVVDG